MFLSAAVVYNLNSLVQSLSYREKLLNKEEKNRKQIKSVLNIYDCQLLSTVVSLLLRKCNNFNMSEIFLTQTKCLTIPK